MYQHKQWRTLVAILLVFCYFYGIFFAVKNVAIREQKMMRDNVVTVQQGIAEHVTNDYSTGNRVVSELFSDAEESQDKASFQIMDALVFDKSDEDSLAIMDVFLKDMGEKYIIYRVDTMAQLSAQGDRVNIPPLILADAKGLKRGAVHVTPNRYIQKDNDAALENIEIYRMKSKPWLVGVLESNEELKAVQAEGEAVLKDKFDALNQKMDTELFVINEAGVITHASDRSIAGAKVVKVSKYEPSARVLGYRLDEKSEEIYGNYFVYTLKTNDHKDVQMIGEPKKTSHETVVFGSNLELFKKDNQPVGHYLSYTVFFNLALSFFVIHLLVNNYLYYMESRKAGRSLND